jgi:hypothetical protein
MRALSRHRPEVFSADVVHYAVVAVFETAQFDWAFPVFGKESVVHGLALTDGMRLRLIEADVIELPQIFSPRQHLFAINAKPLFEFLLPQRSQIGLTSFRDEGWNDKLRSHDASYAQSGRKVVAAIAQFDVIAEEWNCVSYQSL